TDTDGMNLGKEGNRVLHGAAEPIDRPGHDDIDFPARSGLMQRVESGPLIPPFAAADPVILINLVDLPAGTLGDLPQLALLIGRGLVDCGNPEVESGAFHGKSPHSRPTRYQTLCAKPILFAHLQSGSTN